ncbi:tRNA preQ1(34) S-adenosylmethionine ribosyltransferase-isomerase QueA [bacterium]|nr:MAG: tRNA preQ1(34) S-adenosylmethionine ribosyltransferase-isomerase QueA [bacterium]
MTEGFYKLPPERIAQVPPKLRGNAKLLVLDRVSQHLKNQHYVDVVDYLQPGDVLVLNDTKVLPARLLAHYRDGRQRELMLVEKHSIQLPASQAMVIYRGKLRVGDELYLGQDKLLVEALIDGGQAIIKADQSFTGIARLHGVTPLPPYIRRRANDDDKQRYQSVFASQIGSVAAPTASLNMTEELIGRLKTKGIKIVNLTLHVGRGTFLPIRTNRLGDHKMHSEYFEINANAVAQLQATKDDGGKIFALGTTVARALEYASAKILEGSMRDIRGEADIFIYPGYKFKVVDSLITNFHAPESTVIQLAAAFAGVDFLQSAYMHALEHDYRFLSYGDSMLIL